jgi:hypothetical protein
MLYASEAQNLLTKRNTALMGSQRSHGRCRLELLLGSRSCVLNRSAEHVVVLLGSLRSFMSQQRLKVSDLFRGLIDLPTWGFIDTHQLATTLHHIFVNPLYVFCRLCLSCH